MNLSTGMWTCFSRCESGNLGSLLMLAGRARSAAEGWKLAEEFGSNGHVRSNGHTRSSQKRTSQKRTSQKRTSQKRTNSTSRPKWNPSMIKRGRQTGPEADDLLETVRWDREAPTGTFDEVGCHDLQTAVDHWDGWLRLP